MNNSPKQRHILLVDDNPAENYINRITLNDANITGNIVSKEDSSLALEYVTHMEFDKLLKESAVELIIFLDLEMPHMNGWEFLDRLVTFPEDLQSRCKVFLLTGTGDVKDKERSSKYEIIKGFLNKPLLASTVKRLQIS